MSLLSYIKRMLGISSDDEHNAGSSPINKQENTAARAADGHRSADAVRNGEPEDIAMLIPFMNEMVRDFPEERRINLSGSRRIRLVDLLERAGFDTGSMNAEWFYVVYTDGNGKRFREADDLNGCCVFDDVPGDDDGGMVTSDASINVFVYIPYRCDGGDCFIELNMAPCCYDARFGMLFNRVSVATSGNDTDDLKCDKILFTYAREPQDGVFKMLERLKTSCACKMLDKGKPSETEALAMELDDFPSSHYDSAQKFMNDRCWSDAIVCLRKAYVQLKDLINDDGDAADMLGCTCHDLGVCYHEKHLYHKALFFLERAKAIRQDTDMDGVFHDCLVHLNDLRLMLPEENCISNECFVLQNVMEMFFDVIPGELGDLLWIDNRNRKTGSVKRTRDIMRFDIRRAMADTDSMTLHLSYRYRPVPDVRDVRLVKDNLNGNYERGVCSDCDEGQGHMADSVVVINLSKREDVITMGVMVPCFRNADNNHNGYPAAVTLKYRTSEFIGRDEFAAIRRSAVTKKDNGGMSYNEVHSLGNMEEAAFLFVNASEAFNRRLWGDVLFYATGVCDIILMKRASDDINDADKHSLLECMYMLGFVYSELKQTELAIYYLSMLYRFHDISWTTEYINCLADSKDLFAHGVVLEELQRVHDPEEAGMKTAEYNSYFAFLLRRFGRILIEEKNFDDAENIFRQLMNHPASRDIATRELTYIKEHRNE